MVWFVDPGKEVLNVIFGRILAPYVENFDMSQVGYGISTGEVTLNSLKLKKGALDKFRLPVDVIEGHLGRFTMSLHWLTLGNDPVQILVEDVYLLVVPSTQNKFDPAEDEQRAQATKLERLENAELLHMKTKVDDPSDDSPQNQGLVQSLVTKIINNLQVTIKNIHIRYEDKLSVPGSPFAIGFTLSSFTAVSVDEEWHPAFIPSNAGAVRKLAELQSLAVYFDTNSGSLVGLSHVEFVKKFHDMISQVDGHQFILSPVSGQGRIVVNHQITKDSPRFDVQLLFEEIGVAVDNHQYQSAISLLDMFHVYTRQHQYRIYRPVEEAFARNPAKARLTYAATAILEGVREKHRKWTWAYFAERRDDRNRYVEIFQKKVLETASPEETKEIGILDKKLSYEDIRFYRSIARSRLKKDMTLRKRLELEQAKSRPAKQGWGAWLWGSSETIEASENTFPETMTEEQRKELYAALDYDEKSAVTESLDASRDSMKMRISAALQKGSFALKSDPHGGATDIISVVFEAFEANILQRTDNLEASLSLGDFAVYDGTNKATLHPQIVQVKKIDDALEENALQVTNTKSFLYIKYEHNPLDERADNALTIRMRHMEIIYHRGYVEAVYKFLKPPESQLESVEALLSAASQTLEGLGKETRAGLEFALQSHKTIDIRMDMNAPVIIIPEDITSFNCNHLIIDAGHISIESELANKDAVREINLKRSQEYTDEDYKRLESLMYDTVALKLKDAQFVIGSSLADTRKALTSKTMDLHHLLERISVDLVIQNSIVPGALKLARFKVSGKLPSLHVNLSDAKYKSLMRIVDASIPKFDEDGLTSAASDRPSLSLFSQAGSEYHVEVDDDDDDNGMEESPNPNEEFYEAEEGLEERPDLKQHTFELNFEVEELRASLSKFNGDVDNPLGDLVLKRFVLGLAIAKFDLSVDITLSSMAMNLVSSDKGLIPFVSSPTVESVQDCDLLHVTYIRAQNDSPEFLTTFEGIEQSISIDVSTFVFETSPEPIVTLYDFIMSTFVPGNDTEQEVLKEDIVMPSKGSPESSQGKIRVLAKLDSIQVKLVYDSTDLARLSLSTANVEILLRPNTFRVSGRLGNLSLANESPACITLPEFSHILSIEGENFADFSYQTYDPEEDAYKGVKSQITLNAASVKLHFLEEPLHDIYLFMIKLATLKGLYDAATSAAVQNAPEIDLMQFELSVKSPILVFPLDARHSKDNLSLRLGEISAYNNPEAAANKIFTSLRGIQLASNFYYDKLSTLKIIDDIDITGDIIQTNDINRDVDFNYPDLQVAVNISDIRLQLTENQYAILIQLSRSIPRVFERPLEVDGTPLSVESPLSTHSELQGKDLQSEIIASSSRSWVTFDLVVKVTSIRLRLYDRFGVDEPSLKSHGISRFALKDNTLRFKILSDGTGEAQVILKSFTITNTRPGNSKFREIIPAASHDRNQFMILYTMSGIPNGSSLAILTIDSPRVVFAVDPIFALLNFFTTPFPSPSTAETSDTPGEQPSNTSQVDFRVDLHDVAISVIEDDSDSDSQSIKLTISQVLLSQQGITALTVNRLGMSLMRMGHPADAVRFLDDVDLTFSMDNRTTMSHQLTNIEMTSKPIIFRASYRDIQLITSIANKAIELSARSQNSSAFPGDENIQTRSVVQSSKLSHSQKTITTSRSRPAGKARVSMTQEQLKASIDGFRLVLIGDLHEQPMIHLKVKPFIVGAKDWSGELRATATIATHISYWNLTNSHWEPLIDPWTFTTTESTLMSKAGSSGATNVSLTSQERLDINFSTTFADLAMTTMNVWRMEGEQVLKKARGAFAPYRIRNRTGAPIYVWSETGNDSKDTSGVKILDDEIVDWRFDDWRTMREHMSASSSQHSIGIQFVGKPWEELRSVPVDIQGEYVFPLRPKVEKYSNRLLCEVKVVDHVKLVTIRSTYRIENQTLYPLEVTLVDDSSHPVYALVKIAPGKDYSLPIEAVFRNKIRIQPDQGFGYKWCSPIRWDELIAKKGFTIRCAHGDAREAAFRFQAWVQTDLHTQGSGSRQPKINLKLRAPLELENLLPYNVNYRVYDKDTDQNWRSYLRKGGVMPVHSVELGHLVLLNVEVQDTVFKASDFSIISTDENSDFGIERSLSLRDQNNRKLDLCLNYVHYPESGGAFKVQIYSPYVVINKTGLSFNIRSTRHTRSPQDTAGDTTTEELCKPIPYMMSHQTEHGTEFVIRIGDSAWSSAFSTDAPAADMALVIPSQKQQSDEFHLGLSWVQGTGKYKLTKIITLAPRFLLKNSLDQSISFREHGVAPRQKSVIEPGQRSPLLYLRAGNEKLLTIALAGLNAQWSPPINIQDIGSTYLKLPVSGGGIKLIRSDVKLDGSTIFISLFVAPDDWPYAIENSSDYTVLLAQKNPAQIEVAPSPRGNVSYTIAPHSSISYAWDLPAARDKKLQLTINGSQRTVDIKEIGDLIPFKFHTGQRTAAVSLDIRADGHKQVLRITNYNPELSLYKLKKRSESGLTRQDSVSSSAEAFEAITDEVIPTFTFNIEFAGIGVSFVNRQLLEVIYVTMNNIGFEYSTSPVAQAVNLSCGTLQIDNQLHDAIYPVVLQPTPIPKETNGIASLPTVQTSIIWLNDEAHGVLFVKYLSVLLQALTIEVDEDLLYNIYELTQIKGTSWEEDTEGFLVPNNTDIPEPADATADQQDIYFEVLELQPVKLFLSFMRTERVDSTEKTSPRNPFAVLLNALTMTVGNINDAPLELNALAIKDMRLTTDDLQGRMLYHYRQDIIRQVYRILGSADFIGNPVGLFTNVSSGVADIFYEPFNGVVMHGNKELGIGIAKGAASFAKKTIFGLSDSVTKITSSVGKGLSAATFDLEYQAKRRLAQRRNKPRHAIYGFASGGEAWATSMASAVEGVLLKPIEGAETDGALGFFKGIGKGIVGVVTKPVVGAFDFASNVSEGIRNTTTVFDNPARDRIRMPRAIPADGVLRPYSAREAKGQFWMRDLNNGVYRPESYVAHINTAGSDNVVLLTNTRVLSFWSKTLKLEWDLPFSQVQGITVEDTGIRFAHKAGKDQDKFVSIPDKSSQTWFFERVASVARDYRWRQYG